MPRELAKVAMVGPRMEPTWAEATRKPYADFWVAGEVEEFTKDQKRDTMTEPKDSIAQYDTQPRTRDSLGFGLPRPTESVPSRAAMRVKRRK
jgi:hypothetical protein